MGGEDFKKFFHGIWVGYYFISLSDSNKYFNFFQFFLVLDRWFFFLFY